MFFNCFVFKPDVLLFQVVWIQYILFDTLQLVLPDFLSVFCLFCSACLNRMVYHFWVIRKTIIDVTLQRENIFINWGACIDNVRGI